MIVVKCFPQRLLFLYFCSCSTSVLSLLLFLHHLSGGFLYFVHAPSQWWFSLLLFLHRLSGGFLYFVHAPSQWWFSLLCSCTVSVVVFSTLFMHRFSGGFLYEAKSADYAIWRVARDGVLSVS